MQSVAALDRTGESLCRVAEQTTREMHVESANLILLEERFQSINAAETAPFSPGKSGEKGLARTQAAATNIP